MERQMIQEGMKVLSSDGSSLGKVAACGDETFVIEKGWFFPKEYVARYEQVARVGGDELWLRESGRELGGEPAQPPVAEGSAADIGQRAPTGIAEEYRVPLAEEELSAEKHRREAGEVEIRKDVITEQKEVTVPVTREEVHVERVAASGQPEPGDAAFQEDTVRVPIHEEEVEIHKRPVVREEVRVSKQSHQDRERRVAETRKERADIRTEGDVASPSQRG